MLAGNWFSAHTTFTLWILYGIPLTMDSIIANFRKTRSHLVSMDNWAKRRKSLPTHGLNKYKMLFKLVISGGNHSAGNTSINRKQCLSAHFHHNVIVISLLSSCCFWAEILLSFLRRSASRWTASGVSRIPIRMTVWRCETQILAKGVRGLALSWWKTTSFPPTSSDRSAVLLIIEVWKHRFVRRYQQQFNNDARFPSDLTEHIG